jgi:hypothetical protein
MEDSQKFAQYESQMESLTNKLKSEKDNLAELANFNRRLKRKLSLVSKVKRLQYLTQLLFFVAVNILSNKSNNPHFMNSVG